ncbi:uncharacterized protein TRUGW13939_09431 [Talaromyces rugulosus]|uniref:t-SNARE coiled-coil homology domain-containing protein n=1 Tax=Talaromyces rugulosus TaxID=121627 RepID=A0A7H8R7D3_TALRU|nr:uncharacterized protein TRUGW13939_09431 [Talaromyces rugulosus]QKX62272.1 hypothetical protein TRUGW13939_09431 [Talaromyces rugulosus]
MAAAVATRPLPPPTTTRAMSSPVDDDATTTTYTVDIVNLNNLLSRLEHNIFSSALDLRLVQQSHLHRTRVGANVEYANTLFTKIERSLPSIKSPETRHQRTTDLANKRARLARLRERFDEIKTEDYNLEEQDEEEGEGEDLLAGVEPVEEKEEKLEDEERGTEQAGKDEADAEAEAETAAAAAAVSSTLRQRRPDISSTSIAESSTTPAQSSSLYPSSTTTTTTTTGFKPSPTTATTATTTSATTETTLSTHRAEQESLTDSLINLASQLKTSSQAFQSSLENEKSILDRAVEGLDRNVTGLGTAGQRMGVLRRMSEGRGWLGRMLMYAWIFGLWLVAIAIVYLGPKLRF